MKHLSSRTLKHSHTESFVDAWTSSQEASLVSLSHLQESVKQPMTHDTCSHTSETESGTANLELFSSKTWKESSQPRQETENQFSNMSSKSWKAWVTEQRQEYSQRVKLAHLTKESESSSLGSTKKWQTPTTMDIERTPEGMKKRKAYRESIGRKYVEGCLTEQVKNWPTARTSDAEGGRIETEMTEKGFKSKRHKSNQTFGAKLRDAVETHEESWATPVAMNDGMYVDNSPNKHKRHSEGLATQAAKSWPTPTTAEGTKIGNQPNFGQVGLSNHPSIVGHPDRAKLNKSGKPQGSQAWPTPRANKVHPVITEENREQLANRNKANLEEDIAGHCGKATGKLNPDWVEQLMGLPTGWTDFDSSAME